MFRQTVENVNPDTGESNQTSWITLEWTTPLQMVHQLSDRFAHRFLGVTRDGKGVIIDNREFKFLQVVTLGTDL